ncbi:MAG: PadR family transcriptional regulator [Saprospiraceae bacterium]
MTDVKLENTKAQMRKGVLDLCVLSIISKEAAYPTDIINQLKEAKMIVVEGTIYPLLNRLKDANLLEYSWQESKSGPPRKYYHITTSGHEFLEGLMETWGDLNQAVTYSQSKIKQNEQDS